jgi:GNAT superfamily N-acetyltransferase
VVKVRLPVGPYTRVNERGKLEHVDAHWQTYDISTQGIDVPTTRGKEIPEIVREVPTPEATIGRLDTEHIDYPKNWNPGTEDIGKRQSGVLPTAYVADIAARFEPDLRTWRGYDDFPEIRGELLRSLREEGWRPNDPLMILVNDDRDASRPRVQMEGHRRLLAAIELGMDEVPVDVRYFGTTHAQGADLFRGRLRADESLEVPDASEVRGKDISTGLTWKREPEGYRSGNWFIRRHVDDDPGNAYGTQTQWAVEDNGAPVDMYNKLADAKRAVERMQAKRGAGSTPGTLTWEEVQAKHPLYAEDGVGSFAFAVAELAWGGDPTWDGNPRPMPFAEETVNPRDVVFQRYPESDPRTARILEAYRSGTPLAPVLLVDRGGELLAADAHHRLSAAEILGISAPAVIGHSTRDDKYTGAARVGVLDPTPLALRFESGGDAVPGGYNGYFVAYDKATGAKMGYLDYQSAPGMNPLIAMVEVEPAYRRQGVATALVRRMQEDFPGQEIEWGMMTPEGVALRDAIAPEPEVAPGFDPPKDYYRTSWDALPDTLYHVAPGESRQAIAEGGLDATGRTNRLAISIADQEAGGTWENGYYKGPGSEDFSYRPEGVYAFTDASEAVTYARMRQDDTGEPYDIWEVDVAEMRASQDDPAHRTDVLRDPELFQAEWEDLDEREAGGLSDDPEEFWESLTEREVYGPDGEYWDADIRSYVFQKVHPDHLRRIQPYEAKDRESWNDDDIDAYMEDHPEEFAEEDVDASEIAREAPISTEPGTVPIPEGHVRLFHITPLRNAEAIKRDGITVSAARGESYGEPNQVWASSGLRSSQARRVLDHDIMDSDFAVVEFHVSPDRLDVGSKVGSGTDAEWAASLEARQSDVTVRGDVSPDDIVAVHEPWETAYRVLSEYREQVIAGEYDNVLDIESYRKAIERIKAEGSPDDLARIITETPTDKKVSELVPGDVIWRLPDYGGTAYRHATVVSVAPDEKFAGYTHVVTDVGPAFSSPPGADAGMVRGHPDWIETSKIVPLHYWDVARSYSPDSDNPEAEAWRAGLSEDDQQLLTLWESSFEHVELLRRNPDDPVTDHFEELVRSAPRHDGAVYRGIPETVDWDARTGRTFRVTAPTSGSTSVSQAAAFGNMLMRVEGAPAHLLGNGMNEAVVMPGRYKVLGTHTERTTSEMNVIGLPGQTRETDYTVVDVQWLGEVGWTPGGGRPRLEPKREQQAHIVATPQARWENDEPYTVNFVGDPRRDRRNYVARITGGDIATERFEREFLEQAWEKQSEQTLSDPVVGKQRTLGAWSPVIPAADGLYEFQVFSNDRDQFGQRQERRSRTLVAVENGEAHVISAGLDDPEDYEHLIGPQQANVIAEERITEARTESITRARRANYASVPEAEADIRRRFGYADLTGIADEDIESLNEILDEVYRLIEEYPQTMSNERTSGTASNRFEDKQWRFRGIGTYAADSTPPNVEEQAMDSWATTAPRGPRIDIFSPEVPAPLHPTQDPDQAGWGPYIWIDSENVGDYFSVMSALRDHRDAIVHEMGHVVAYIGDTRYTNGHERLMREFRWARDEVYEADGIKNPRRQWMRDLDSIYGDYSIDNTTAENPEEEAFAELFAVLNAPGLLDETKDGRKRSAAAKRRLLRIRRKLNEAMGMRVL